MTDTQIGALLHGQRYRIRQQLGRGGFGAVYLADDTRLPGRQVALKENLNVNKESRQQFKREALLLARLRHPNLPQVTDYFSDAEGRQFLVMDYIPGENLRQLMSQRAGPLPLEEVLAIADQVMQALAYMHTWRDPESGKVRPIIHRDVKPDNIKRTPDGRVLLVDFGIAKVDTNTETVLSARALTPGYAPIEQYGGGTDERSDVYALGATLYALLTGKTPPSAVDLAAGATMQPLRSPTGEIPPSVARVIERAMKVNARDRYPSIEKMYLALFGKPLPTTPITTPTARGRSRLQQGWLYPTALGLSGLIVVAALWWLLAGGGASTSGTASVGVAAATTAATVSAPTIAALTIAEPTTPPTMTPAAAALSQLTVAETSQVATAAVIAQDMTPTGEAPVSPLVADDAPALTAAAIYTPASFNQTVTPTMISELPAPVASVPSPTSSPTKTPFPTSTPLPAPTPTPTYPAQRQTSATPSTPKGGPSAATIFSPPDQDTGNYLVTFRWSANAPLAPGQEFEVVFWDPRTESEQQARGWVRSTTNSEVTVNMANRRTGAYQWALYLVQPEPYRRLARLAEPRIFMVTTSETPASPTSEDWWSGGGTEK